VLSRTANRLRVPEFLLLCQRSEIWMKVLIGSFLSSRPSPGDLPHQGCDTLNTAKKNVWSNADVVRNIIQVKRLPIFIISKQSNNNFQPFPRGFPNPVVPN
jgi:hypothetical protein